MTSENSLSEDQLLWNQYSMLIDLYKFYMDVALRANIFYYAVTGGILTYYFSHAAIPLIQYALYLPLLMSVVFVFLLWQGASLMKVLREEIFRISEALKLRAAPETNLFIIFLRASIGLFLSMAVALVIIIYRHG